MTNSELELWNRIRKFEFDKPGVKLTFAKRLAKENGISLGFANEIVEEYRKFLFLCCVSSHQVSPSYYVDQAWHLHLTYTKSYWNELCKNTLGKELHHNPTEGGELEDLKFSELYRRSLELYETYFSKAPASIWPDENMPPTASTAGIDGSRFWVIPKPAFGLRGNKGILAAVAVMFLALILGCTSEVGSLFIVIPIVVIVGVIIWAVRRAKGKGGEGGSGCGAGIGGGCSSGDSDCSSDGGGDSGCSSGCSGGCGGGD